MIHSSLSRRTALKLAISASTIGLSQSSLVRAGENAPQKGGTLRLAVGPGSTNDTLDPATYVDVPQYILGWTLANNLVELDSNKNPQPELAESWEALNGAKRWVFKLRGNVTFHNGKELTAADVVYSLQRHIAENSTSSAKSLLGGVNSIRADGKNTVVIDHETGNSDLHYILADFHLQIVPEGFSDWARFVGTGPYKLTQFEPGVSFTAERNANYWKQDRGWFDAVQYMYVNDITARVNALVSGSVDAVGTITPIAAKLISSQDAARLVVAEGAAFYDLAMKTDAPPFNDNNVRLAFKHAINREQLLQVVGQGYGAIGNDHPIPANDPFFNTEVKQRSYDPAKAKWHLKQAGHGRLPVFLDTADGIFPGSVDIGVIIKETAAPAGFDITVRNNPSDSYWSDVWMKRDLCAVYWGTRATPGLMFALAYECGAAWNDTYWCNDEFSRLLVEAKTAVDFETKKKIYWRLQEIVHNEGGVAAFMFPAVIDAYSDKIGGVRPDATRALMGCRIAERAWMTS